MMSYYSICVPSVYFWPFVSSFMTGCQWIAEISCLFKDFLIILVYIHSYQTGFLSIIMIDSYQIPVICHIQVGIIVKVFLLHIVSGLGVVIFFPDFHSLIICHTLPAFHSFLMEVVDSTSLRIGGFHDFLIKKWEDEWEFQCVQVLEPAVDFFLCHISVHFLFLVQRYNKKTRPPNFSSLFLQKIDHQFLIVNFRSSSSWYLLHFFKLG